MLEHIHSSFIDLPGYQLFRHDVAGSVAKHGVCCYVKTEFFVGDVTTPCPNVLTVHLPSFNVYIIIMYRAPSNTPEANLAQTTFLAKFCVGKEVIVLGDFNLPTIDWTGNNFSMHLCPVDKAFHDVFTSLGLTQWIGEPTYPRSGNILDLVLTSETDRVGEVKVLDPLPGSDHCPTMFAYVFAGQQSVSHNIKRIQRAWHKGNYGAISGRLAEIDWDLELAYLNANQSFNLFTIHLAQLVELYVPQKTSDEQSSKLPWATRPPRSLIDQRHKSWQAYKKARQRLGRHSTETRTALSEFTGLNRQFRSFAARSQAEYESKLIYDSKENPKLIHSHIRRRKVGCPTIGPLKLSESKMTDDPHLMSEIFVEAFSTVFTRGSPVNPSPHQCFDGNLSDIVFSVDDVQKILSNLDGTSAMGPDEVHPLLLKKCASQLALPLHRIFSRSLLEGRLPDIWKSSLVIPIFKKGHRYTPLNYRPISLTSVPGKCMERIICSQLSSYLEEHSLLSSEQFGFRVGRSTQEQLLLTYNFVSKQIDEGYVTDLILIDFSKAFDVVVHSLLLDKLRCLGIQGTILQWISGFLHDREMRVSVKGCVSKPKDVASGVPQGSILGPTLFLVYINSVASQLSSQFKIFADDLKMYSSVKIMPNMLPSSCISAVQNDIDVLYSTALSWGLKVNVKKSMVLRFPRSQPDRLPSYTLGGLPLPVADTASDLGVTVDTDLKFHSHAQQTAHKASGLSHSLLKATVCRTEEFMVFLLKTHIRPILDYSSCLWSTGYAGDVKLLESVQRRWTKQVVGLSSLSYADRLKSLNLFSIQGRLLRADLIMYWKILNGHSCINPEDIFILSPETRTRGHMLKLFCPSVRTDIRKRFFSVRCVQIWNSLPAPVVCASDLNQFKKMLHSHLDDMLYAYID